MKTPLKQLKSNTLGDKENGALSSQYNPNLLQDGYVHTFVIYQLEISGIPYGQKTRLWASSKAIYNPQRLYLKFWQAFICLLLISYGASKYRIRTQSC